ncbi:MAG: hypothetical protein ACXIVQ_12505 [Acidimicrobiales bacterium]
MHRTWKLVLGAVLVIGLVACGDDDTTADDANDSGVDVLAPDEGTEPADGAPQDGDAGRVDDGEDQTTEGAAGSAGTVTVDGTTYPMDESQQCDTSDLGLDGVERELEAQFWASTDDGRVQLDVYVQEFAGTPSIDVSWSGPEGVFGGGVMQLGGAWTDDNDETYADAPVTVDGNRTTGSLTLYDAMTMSESVDIDFDVTFPEALTACR